MSVVFVVLAGFGAFGAVLTLVMSAINLSVFRKPGASCRDGGAPLVSVCIPARDEEANIEACVRSLLASEHAAIEVLVYDDESTDRTPEILRSLMAEDDRVRTVPTVPLPAGWNGKQHGCHRMSEAARGAWLLFTDADVRFEPGAVGAGVAYAERAGVDLVSTFPRQIVRTLGELMTVPSIFFVLFSYLPFPRMRNTTDPAAAAGCGQFLFVRTPTYRAVGGHTVCFDSMHDGIKLPRAFRAAGHKTDLFDGTDLCAVRMYRGLGESWRGFAKNAYEGLGSVGLLVFLTVFHLVAHIGPWAAMAWVILSGVRTPATPLLIVAVVASASQRVMLARRFRHTILLAVLHPVTVAMMVAIQWHSFVKHLRGTRAWRGRSMDAVEGAALSAGDGLPGGSPEGGLHEPAEELVVLVDEHDTELGTMGKAAAHLDGGTLHRAFSVFLFAADGRVMLQRRAVSKYHFGGLWTNTCCSHPRLGESPEEAGRRRLMEEMGIDAPVERVTSFVYRAHDGVSGLTEHELDHVLSGRFDATPVLNLEEADDWCWMAPSEIDADLRARPERYTPWFPIAWRALREAMHSSPAGA